jgi:hypothetical protein
VAAYESPPRTLPYQQGDQQEIDFDLRIQGVVPVQSTIPLNVSAKGGIDVELLQLLSPDVHASGKMEIDLRAGGAIAQPKTEVTGTWC